MVLERSSSVRRLEILPGARIDNGLTNDNKIDAELDDAAADELVLGVSRDVIVRLETVSNDPHKQNRWTESGC